MGKLLDLKENAKFYELKSDKIKIEQFYFNS